MTKRTQPHGQTAWRNRITGYGSVDPEELLANPLNYRIHPKAQQDALAGTLNSIGWIQDVIVNAATGFVLDGHLRVALALRTNQPEIPVKYVELSPEEEALALATLDPLTSMAGTDAAKLDELLQQVQTDEAAIQEMLAGLAEEAGLYLPKGEPSDAEPQIDRAEELRAAWGVELGQLWRLASRTAGQCHYVICGDCTEAVVVERVMGNDLAELVVTDPPYGVSYADKNRFLNAISPANRIEEPILNDHQSKEQTQALWRSAFERMSAVMCPGAVVYCFMPQGGDQMMMMMMMMMMGAGIEPRHELIWLKNNHVLGRVDYAYKHEPILYAWKDGGHKFYGDFQTSVLEYPKPQLSDMHPTTKPLALVERLISNSSRPTGVVYDCFLGSGTTLIACENLSRQCRAVELSPGYVAVALERYFQAFGIRAELVG